MELLSSANGLPCSTTSKLMRSHSAKTWQGLGATGEDEESSGRAREGFFVVHVSASRAGSMLLAALAINGRHKRGETGRRPASGDVDGPWSGRSATCTRTITWSGVRNMFELAGRCCRVGLGLLVSDHTGHVLRLARSASSQNQLCQKPRCSSRAKAYAPVVTVDGVSRALQVRRSAHMPAFVRRPTSGQACALAWRVKMLGPRFICFWTVCCDTLSGKLCKFLTEQDGHSLNDI